MATKKKRLPYYYLFTGYVQYDDKKNIIEPKPGSLDTLRNTVIFTTDPLHPQGKLEAWKTNKNGVFYKLKLPFHERSTPVHQINKSQKFHFPPPDILMYTWAAKGEEWSETLSKFLKTQEGKGVELNKYKVLKKHLKKPDPSSKHQADKDYAAWYTRLSEDEPLYGFLLGKTRAVILMFSEDEFKGSTIDVTLPDGKTTKRAGVDLKDGMVVACITGDADSLPAGLYNIVVNPADIKADKWNGPVKSSSQYTFTEKFRFNISNFAGEFEIQICDPISVEEAIMLQFPSQYAHLIARAKQLGDYPTVELDENIPQANIPPTWIKHLSLMHSKTKWAVDFINADGSDEHLKKIGKVIWDSVPADQKTSELTKKSIELAFSVKENAQKWMEFREKLAAQKELAAVKKVLWNTIESSWQRNRWWKYVTEQKVKDTGSKILELDKLSLSERESLLAAGIPEKESKLVENIGTAGKVVEKALLVGDVALNIYETAESYNAYSESKLKREETVADLNDLVKQYQDKFPDAACREGMGNLERFRTASVLAQLDVDQKFQESTMKSLDSVLGIMALIPGAQEVAGIIVLVKETAELAADVVMNFAKWCDEVAFGSFVTEELAKLRQISDLLKASFANQALMPSSISNDGGKDDLLVQLRIRAEALYGLVGLLVRASISAETEDEYVKKIEKYKVKEYIHLFLMNDQWEFPIKPMVPISMDVYWMYARSSFGQFADFATYRAQFGFDKPLTTTALSGGVGGMFVLGVTDAVLKDNVKANYQKSLPIHYLAESDINKFSKSFQTSFQNLEPESIDYMCIYWRPKDSKSDAEWKLINPNNASEAEVLDDRSPYDQIRILIVLKKEVEKNIYPVSIQLIRTDGYNYEGPVYKDIVRLLDPHLLSNESQWKGRLGAVIYPFYQLGKVTFPGTKPLAGDTPKNIGVNLYYNLGYLDKCTYAYKVWLGGDTNHGWRWITLGSANNQPSELDEYKVSVNHKRDKDEANLLIAEFLKSRSETFTLPELFDMRKGVGPVYLRVGGKGKPYILPSPDSDAIVKFDDYNWDTEVDVVLFVWADKLATQSYERANLSWKKIPIEFSLVNYEGADKKGPKISNEKLYYLGQVSTPGIDQPASFNWETKIPEKLKDIVSQLGSSEKERVKFNRAIAPDNFGSMGTRSARYFLFAVHATLNYWTPEEGVSKAKHCKGVRPFSSAEIKYPDYYRYSIVDIVTGGQTGLNENTIIAPLADSYFKASGYSREEYEFHFQAPKSTGSYPWKDLSSEISKEWIEKKSEKLVPDVSIIKE